MVERMQHEAKLSALPWSRDQPWKLFIHTTRSYWAIQGAKPSLPAWVISTSAAVQSSWHLNFTLCGNTVLTAPLICPHKVLMWCIPIPVLTFQCYTSTGKEEPAHITKDGGEKEIEAYEDNNGEVVWWEPHDVLRLYCYLVAEPDDSQSMNYLHYVWCETEL